MRKRIHVVAAVAVLGMLLAAVPQYAAASPAGPPVPTLTWRTCGATFQCATARVPLDYGRPNGPTISIALVRLPASDPAHRIGSLFVNPGGPGGSGVDFVKSAAEFLYPKSVRARFDIVGFDPRGVARSMPIQCFSSNQAEASFLANVPPFPVGATETAAFISTWTQFDGICVRNNAVIMRHMASADAARDLDLLRRAVGDRKLTYDGVSYGTYLGDTYANLFPDKVRALVIDGVIEPTAWATGRGDGNTVPFSTRLHSDQGAETTLNQFLRLCHQAGPACAFSSGSPRDKLETLLARLRQHPLLVPGPMTITYADVISLLLGAMYDPGSWPSLAQTLQVLYDTTHPTATGLQVRALAARLAGPAYQNGLDSFSAVACTDTDNPHDAFAWPRAAKQADQTAPHFGAIWTYASQQCATWPVPDDNRFTGPFTARTASPVLVIGNFYDPATRYQGAQAVANELPRARLLTLAGWGHTSLAKSSCIDGFVALYLIDQLLPPRGAVCAPDRQPFVNPGAQTLAPAIPAAPLLPPPLRRAIAALG